MNIDSRTIDEMQKLHVSLEIENTTLRHTITILEEQVNWFKRQLFGKRSEKIKDITNVLTFDFYQKPECDLPKEKSPTSPRQPRQKTTGNDKISFPDNLPKKTIIIDLSEEEKVCKQTGLPLIKIGEEITSKLALQPGSYYIKEYIRPKYAMPKGAEEKIITAELPDSFLPKCRIDVSLMADILTKKFADHLPLYRISEIFSRDQIQISRQTLSTWVLKAGKALEPIYEEMRKEILQSGNIFIDETHISLQEKGKGKVHQAFMWVISGGKTSDPPSRIYDFRYNRKHEHAIEMLVNYQGVLHSDKYGAYETIAKQKHIIWCPCWAHIRRHFFEAETGDAVLKTWILDKINALFVLERDAWKMDPEERLKFRQTNEIPIIDELIHAVKEALLNDKIIHRSKYRKALGYFCSLIPQLKNYCMHPFARLDNNVAERAIRPLTIGRKNWLFVGSQEGGKAAAVLFSIIQTCRALQINPREYLEDILGRIMGHNFQKLHELLPINWLKARC